MSKEHQNPYEKFIGLPYRKPNGPFLLRESQFKPREGINCQLLIHLLYRNRLGIELPIGMWSKEIFEDKIFFDNIDQGKALQEADILVLTSRDNKPYPKKYHLTYYTGYSEDGQPLLIHANSLNNTEIAPLDYITEFPRHACLVAIKRLKRDYLPSSLPLRQGRADNKGE